MSSEIVANIMLKTATRNERIQTIRQTLELLVAPGGVVEIRALNVPREYGAPVTVSGYYDNLDKAADDVEFLNGRKPSGIYLVLNEINPALKARSPNKFTEKPKATTSDADILRRRWLPIDFDPKRPSGISSNEDEHCAAEDMARECAAWLSLLGWPQPILADSGNGAHLLYRIDLPNDAASTAFVKNTLCAVAAKFGGRAVDVDLSVFNAARIWKLYGTTARKGHDVAERPHRIAKITEQPE